MMTVVGKIKRGEQHLFFDHKRIKGHARRTGRHRWHVRIIDNPIKGKPKVIDDIIVPSQEMVFKLFTKMKEVIDAPAN